MSDSEERSVASAGSGVGLRDHFAAAALTGFLAWPGHDEMLVAENVAKHSYAIADAMLRERSKAKPDLRFAVLANGDTVVYSPGKHPCDKCGCWIDNGDVCCSCKYKQ